MCSPENEYKDFDKNIFTLFLTFLGETGKCLPMQTQVEFVSATSEKVHFGMRSGHEYVRGWSWGKLSGMAIPQDKVFQVYSLTT